MITLLTGKFIEGINHNQFKKNERKAKYISTSDTDTVAVKGFRAVLYLTVATNYAIHNYTFIGMSKHTNCPIQVH